MDGVQGYDGLLALARVVGAAVQIDGVPVLPDEGRGPLVLVGTEPGAPVRSTGPAPGRRVLRAVAPVAPLVGVDEREPLVATTVVPADGSGALTGRRFVFDEVGAVPGAPVARSAGVVVAAVDGDEVVVGGTRWLTDGFVAAGDNPRLLVWALTGTVEEALVDVVHGTRSAPAVHGDPPVFTAAPDEWRLEELPSTGSAFDDPAFAAAVRRQTRLLPPAVHDALLTFADEGHKTGALLVRGVPVGPLPPTPADPETPAGKDRVSELLLLGAARVLGQPVGYLPEHGGDVVQNLVPTPEGAARQVSTSSAVTLAWHTEAAFHPHRPRFLLLLCLRGDPEARTTLCSIREIVASLRLRTRQVLAEPRFRTAADESYVGGRSGRLGHPVTVLQGDPSAPQLLFDADLMVGADAEAQAALDELGDAIARSHTSLVLEPGDLLVVDNTVAVHGRTPFRARYDGTDRWLQRAFVVADLVPSAGQRAGRVVRTRFAA